MQDPLEPERGKHSETKIIWKYPSYILQKPHHLLQSHSQFHSLQQEIEWYKAPVEWTVRLRGLATAFIGKRKEKKTSSG